MQVQELDHFRVSFDLVFLLDESMSFIVEDNVFHRDSLSSRRLNDLI